jgi:hypothetical protein
MQENQRARAHITIAELSSHLTDQTLFIIGNGFDLMHGVPSRYHDFRDSIGRRNTIRTTMESYIHTPDIWGDFEHNLAYLDRAMMMGTLDDWLDDFGVLDEDDDDFSAADFFAAWKPPQSLFISCCMICQNDSDNGYKHSKLIIP